MSTEELQSIGSVVTGMIRALPVFTGEVQVPSDGAHDVPTAQHIAELLTLAMQVLQRGSSQVRMKMLLSKENGHPGIVYAVTSYLVSRLKVAPGENGAEANKRAIQALRVLVLKSLSQLVALTSFDHVPDSTSRIGPTCATFLYSEFEELQVPAVLIGISSAKDKVPEDIKIAAAECLFVYALRNAAGRAALVSEPESLTQLFSILESEQSHMVRNYIAACIRECTTDHGAQVEAAGLSSVAPSIISNDGSADVRVLLLECLEVVVKTHPMLKLDPRLAETLVHLLAFKDALPGVTDAACHFVDTFVSIESEKCFDRLCATPQLPLSQLPCELTIRFVGSGGVETLVNAVLAKGTAKTSALKCRALRRVIQHAHHRICVGRRVANSSVDALFALLVRQARDVLASDVEILPTSAESSDDEFKSVAMVELALAMALILAQSSDMRAFIQHSVTLRNPEYAATIRTALLAFLDRAAQEYFSELSIVDAQSGRRLNVLDGVEWDDDGWPTRESLCQSLHGVQATGIMPLSMQYSLPEIQEMRMCRFTQVLLRYAIHLALSEDNDAHDRAAFHERSKGANGSRAGSVGSLRHSVSPVQQSASPATPAGATGGLIRPRGAGAEPVASAYPPPPQWAGQYTEPPSVQQTVAEAHAPTPLAQTPTTPTQAVSTRRELLPDSIAREVRPTAMPQPQPQPQPQPPQYTLPSQTPALPAVAVHHDPMAAHGASPYQQGMGRLAPHAHPYPPHHPHPGMHPPTVVPPSRSSSRSHSQPLLGFAPLRQTSRLPTPEEIIQPQRFVANEAALRFAVQFSKHYVSSATASRQSVNNMGPTRWAKQPSSNPWAPPVKKFPANKSWTVQDLRPGDLFMFAIPHERLSVAAVESVLYAAQKHQATLKKAFVVTPQRQKSRRWALFDLLNMVCPHMQDFLIRLAKLLVAIGEKDAMVPIFMLREREIAQGEVDVNPSNLVEVVEQLTYYATVHCPQTDEEVDVIAKMQTLARTDPVGFADLSSSSTSSSESATTPGK